MIEKQWSEILQLVLSQLIKQNEASNFFSIDQITSIINKFSESLLSTSQRSSNIADECIKTLNEFKDIFISNENKWTLKEKDSTISSKQLNNETNNETINTEVKTPKRARNENETSFVIIFNYSFFRKRELSQ